MDLPYNITHIIICIAHLDLIINDEDDLNMATIPWDVAHIYR